MKIRFRGVLELIEWSFESLADRLGIKRRHIMFGLLVLLISVLFTGWYIYQKNWFIEGKRKAGRSEQQLTISLNGENSAAQEMSEEIRDSILETPMAAASASQAAAQSASNMNAARSNPDSASSQSASASGAQSPVNAASAAGSSSSFSPSVTTPNSSVMSRQARAENSQSMTQASAQSSAPSASRMSAARSNPQNSAAQSAAAQSATAPESPAASDARSALAPSVSQGATSTVKSGQPRVESSQTMSAVSAQSMAESASTMSAARSAPSPANAQSTSANSAASPTSISAADASSPLSPSSPRAATSTVMTQRSAQAAPSQTMAQASAQSLAPAATGSRGTARNSPSQSMTQASGSAQAANTASAVSGSGATGSFSPSSSAARAATSTVMTQRSAQAAPSQTMAQASAQSLAPAATGSRGTARNSPSQSSGQGLGSAQASNTASSISGSVSQPVRFAGARRNPLKAYVSRPNESQPSAAPVRVAVTGNLGGRGSFSSTLPQTPQIIPTFEKVQLNPSAELSELPPLANPYELRLSPKLRADFVKRQGGGPETEAAVALALEWLKRNQSKDGRWNHRFGHSTAATGAATLAFLGWGAKHTEPGPYQQTLSKAIDWMLSVEKNGDLRFRGNMYDHGIAAIAILEAYNLTKDERLRAPAARVLAFTLKAQNPQTGGWRYKPHREDPSEKGDLSVSGWQMMALKSARLGGMKVPEASFSKARKFLDGVGVRDKGFQYRPGWTPSSAMIAEGLFCEQMLSAGETTPKMEQCLNLIQKQLPSNNRVDYYYWYYGSLAMHQAQGQDWKNWNNKLKPILLRKQILRGNNRGAWAPEGKDSKAAGRVVTTALAALSLEVYYRYLPLYTPEFSKAGK